MLIQDGVRLDPVAGNLRCVKRPFVGSLAPHHPEQQKGSNAVALNQTVGVEVGCKAARSRQKVAGNRHPVLEPPVGSTEKE